MLCAPRPIADGVIYHVVNRGDNRQPVLLGEGDYLAFLKTIADLREQKALSPLSYSSHKGGRIE